jgi:transposase
MQVNVAYGWFPGLSLSDKEIDASTFSQNRRQHFEGSNIEQVMRHWLIGGQALYSDSPHLKANVNKHRR